MGKATKASVYLRIAVNAPVRKSYDYQLPDDWRAPLPQPGCRVKVPFGRRSAIGVLLFTHAEKPAFALKPIEKILDDKPLFDAHLLELLNWAATYYCHAIGEVFATALPLRLRQGKAASKPPIYNWRIADGTVDVNALLANAPKQRALYEFIANSEHGRQEAELQAKFVAWRAPLKALREKQLLRQDIINLQTAGIQHNAPQHQLNVAQQQALQQLTDNAPCFKTFLLHGVTGSGKTEVYLQASRHILQQGKQVLILTPEIGLTPQLVNSFQARFSIPVAVLHSNLNDRERLDAWLAARDGSAKIIIGTRSAVFTPMAALALIIIDEEHDGSFKQMEGFRYSARDVAIKRAALLNIPVLLGSATPSLESINNTVAGKSTLLSLPERAGAAVQPDIFRLDLRGQRLVGGLLPYSLDLIKEEIERGGQAIVFLNHRGYAPNLLCGNCGWRAGCQHCDVRLTLHKRDARLRCHVCSYSIGAPPSCPDCGGEALLQIGYGTERLEETLREQFPDTGVVRIDRDSTRPKGALKDIIHSMRSGKNKILIGTQMLAKGHHFPQMGTVIIVDADNGLYGLDFRAKENMAQLITQVAGRAGRLRRRGKVYIQTWHPEHPFFNALQTLPYREFAAQLLKERQLTGMPPYGYLALLRVEAKRIHQVERFINRAHRLIEKAAHNKIEILGPATAPLERKAGYLHMQLLLKAAHRALLHQLLGPWITSLGDIREASQVRWSIDVDPYHLY